MSDRMDFEIVCPNDHDQTVTLSQEEFEEVLKSGAWRAVAPLTGKDRPIGRYWSTLEPTYVVADCESRCGSAAKRT
jgi:hypothetical protein